jgi:hypothetical protein
MDRTKRRTECPARINPPHILPSNAYDAPELLGIQELCEFAARRRDPLDSSIPDISAVEIERRVRDAVVVEGRKR